MPKIRLIQPEDVDQCYEIVRHNWSKKVADRFLYEVHHTFNPTLRWPPLYYVYTDPDVRGFAGMQSSWIMHGVWDFIWINVREDSLGSGIGSSLTKHRIKQVKKQGGKGIHLVTKEITFFYQFGFTPAYAYKGGWTLMVKELGELKL
jgi:N-acetylglutamate synthase-like GNAT family acetyltransferase